MPVDLDRAGDVADVVEQDVFVALDQADGGVVADASATQSVLTKRVGMCVAFFFRCSWLSLSFIRWHVGR